MQIFMGTLSVQSWKKDSLLSFFSLRGIGFFPMKKHVFPSFREIGKIKKDVKDDDRETDNEEPRKRVEGKEEMQSKPCTQGNEQGGQGFREHLAQEGEGGDFQNPFVKQVFRDDPKKANRADGEAHAKRAEEIRKYETYNDVHRGSREGENGEGVPVTSRAIPRRVR